MAEPTGAPIIPTNAPEVTSATATPAAVAAVATQVPQAQQAPQTTDYIVQAGDTLLSIAMAYHVSMASIMLLNDMGDSQVVKLGQALHIPTAKTWDDENTFWFVYVVQAGEALSTIATRFGVKIDDLVRVNQLSDASAIRVGQMLVIPAAAFTPNTPAEEPASPDPTTPSRTEAEPDQAAVAQASEAEVAQASKTEDAAAQDEPAESAKGPAEPAQVPSQAQASVAIPAGAADVEVMRAQLLALYNQARAAYGRGALAGSVVLQVSAQGHAQDCAQRGYGSHTGSDGSTTSMRIANAGYTARVSGENWAWGHSAAEVFDMWFNQESDGGPHRSNILSTRYAEVGFGVAPASGGFYFIADFGAP